MPPAIESALTNAQRDSLEITDFIFHVIEPSGEGGDPVKFLDEVQLGARQKEFFLGRLKDVLTGTQYVFKPDAVHLKEKCEQLIAAPDQFNQLSRHIATDFSERHLAQMSDGVFVVCLVRYLAQANTWKKLVLLIKMDKSASFSYSRERQGDRWVAILDEVPNALIENKAAIQKSAVIDVEGHFAWHVLAYDRVQKPRLGEYYKAFLGVQERQQDSELTRQAHSVVRKWARKLTPEQMPEGEDAYTYANRSLNYLRDNVEFDSDAFIASVVRDENPERRRELIESLQGDLVNAGVYGQNFAPKPDSLSKAEITNRYQTYEGVTITFEGTRDIAGFNIEDLPDGRQRITIETAKVFVK